MRINRLFPIFCVSEVTVRNEKHRLPTAEVVKGKGRISRQAVALLSVLGLAFSTLLAVVPLTAPAVEQGGQSLLPLLLRVLRITVRARPAALTRVTAKLPGSWIFGRLVRLLVLLGGLMGRCERVLVLVMIVLFLRIAF